MRKFLGVVRIFSSKRKTLRANFIKVEKNHRRVLKQTYLKQ